MSRTPDAGDGSPRTVADLLARYGEQAGGAAAGGRRHRRRAPDPEPDPVDQAPPARADEPSASLGAQLLSRRGGPPAPDPGPSTDEFPRVDPLLREPPAPSRGPLAALRPRSGEPPAGLGPPDPAPPAVPSWGEDPLRDDRLRPAPSRSLLGDPYGVGSGSHPPLPPAPAADPFGPLVVDPAVRRAEDPWAERAVPVREAGRPEAPRPESLRPDAPRPDALGLDAGRPAPAAEPERTGAFDVRAAFDDDEDDAADALADGRVAVAGRPDDPADPWAEGARATGARTGATVAPRPGRRRSAEPDPEPGPDPWGIPDPAAPAGGRRALEPDEDADEELTPDSPAKEWLLMAAQVAGGVVGGAALWLACEWLWQRIPVVALVVALAVITGLVWVVRRVRRAEDLNTTVIAVLVGLFVTVSPAALLLVGR